MSDFFVGGTSFSGWGSGSRPRRTEQAVEFVEAVAPAVDVDDVNAVEHILPDYQDRRRWLAETVAEFVRL